MTRSFLSVVAAGALTVGTVFIPAQGGAPADPGNEARQASALCKIIPALCW